MSQGALEVCKIVKGAVAAYLLNPVVPLDTFEYPNVHLRVSLFVVEGLGFLKMRFSLTENNI